MNVTTPPRPSADQSAAKATTGKTLDLLIVGAGFAGLYMLYKARQLGLNALVLEAADGVGGTWYHNRYPGARVDIQSMEYSFSFSEELQQEWKWTERYSPQAELLRYANHVADRFGLRDGILLNTRMEAAAWDEASHTWQVRAATGASWSARYLVMASGPLSTPNLPSFEGLESFAGPVLHTGFWPHEAVSFKGKRVAVIGTGSSGIQSIPVIAKEADQVLVFQRTPNYVVPAHNRPLDPAYEARIKADYAGFRARNRLSRNGFGSELQPHNVSALEVSAQELEARLEERWQIGGFGFLGAFSDLMMNPEANALAANFVRRKIREAVHDPKTAALLTPDQTIGCKRLCVANDYYETFNRPNVKLIDVSKTGIESITPKGLVAGGQAYEFDMLVLATGFDAMTGTLMRLDLRGQNGLTIQQKWSEGPKNFLGMTIAGFPNLFNIAGPGSTAVFTNVMVSIEHHVNWIGACITYMDQKGLKRIAASDKAESDWVAYVNSMAVNTLLLTCNSWYLGANIPGKPRQFMPLASGFPVYAQKCAEVAHKGYEGFDLA